MWIVLFDVVVLFDINGCFGVFIYLCKLDVSRIF